MFRNDKIKLERIEYKRSADLAAALLALVNSHSAARFYKVRSRLKYVPNVTI